MTASDTDRRPKFASLDVMRGLAACLVACHHASNRAGELRFGGVKPFDGAFDGLYIFVDFFFVLSGFVLAWVHWGDLGRPGRVPRYFKRRFARIYPVYWAVLLLFLVGHIVHPAEVRDVPLSPTVLATSFLMIPNSGPTLLGVAWTLYYEVWFYIVFGAVLLVGRVGFYGIALWCMAIVVFYLMPIPKSFPLNFYLNPYCLQFAMGIGVAAILRVRHIPAPRSCALFGSLAFIVLAFLNIGPLVDSNQLAMRLIMGTLASLSILGLVECERDGSLVVPAWLQHFGAASYSIYLIHVIVEAPFLSFSWPVLSKTSPEIRTLICAFVAILIGYMFHRLVELPLTEQVRKLLFPRPGKPPALNMV
jgi:peptidoglycan/LPS O-acetylase OafA/YrhL